MLPGQQIILDLYNCSFDKLNAQTDLEDGLRKAMGEHGIPAVSSSCHPHEDANGFSLVLFHQQGHVAVHTFPALGFAAVDIFSTTGNPNLAKMPAEIKKSLGAEKSKNTYLKRGDFGSLSDMKPTVKKQTKAWRRVRNTSNKMMNILKNKKPTID